MHADDICPDLSLQLKVAKGRLTSAAFQEEVIEQVRSIYFFCCPVTRLIFMPENFLPSYPCDHQPGISSENCGFPQAFELLAHHLAQWSNSIAFPEMSFWTLFHMKKFTRNTKVERLRKLTRQVRISAMMQLMLV